MRGTEHTAGTTGQPPGIDEKSPTWYERVERFLQASVPNPSDSYLFSGADGARTMQIARHFAAAIICPAWSREQLSAPAGLRTPLLATETGEGSDHYRTCNVCRRVVAGLHPDVQDFQPEGYTFPVELIREIVASSAQTPMEAERRVFILDEADRILERSQNALLKALEEPNQTVTWILVARSIDPLLPTIVSRCRVLEFPALGGQPGAKKGSLPPTSVDTAIRSLAFRAATHTDPSAVWALDVVEELKELAASAREAAAAGHRGELEEFEQTMGGGRGTGGARKRITDRQKRTARRVEAEVFVDFVYWLGSSFRDLAAVTCGAGPEALMAPDYAARALEAAGRRPAAFWLDMVQRCLEAQLAIHENANPALAVESVVLRLVSLSAGRLSSARLG